ncbi:hypothetical protein BCV72DRAFT_209948 [Rhizopus microsporus var. microsporus]|uniref:Uncharacterized protein n=1 Tax=Rhizopus microsporus var. microsporus TaxID=86635 RepID=A0A1X0QZC2_RHIZD|nr:hypothetical protein BCV72DRAFT_209948 [Rhizopus microsporus var. microsporus]
MHFKSKCILQLPETTYSLDSSEPSYAQLYINDLSCAVLRRSERNENLNSEIITELSAILSHCSPFFMHISPCT